MTFFVIDSALDAQPLETARIVTDRDDPDLALTRRITRRLRGRTGEVASLGGCEAFEFDVDGVHGAGFLGHIGCLQVALTLSPVDPPCP